MNTAIVSSEWETLQRQAKAFVASGLLPDSVTKGVTPEVAIAKVVTIVTMGQELGLSPLYSLRVISVIRGKPCLASEVIHALCLARIPTFELDYIETTAEICRVKCRRSEKREWQEFSFTIEDAKKAQLLGNPNSGWGKYPQAMLRARVTSAACRAIAPDAVMNVYSPEEMGGDVIDVTPPDKKDLPEAKDVTKVTDSPSPLPPEVKIPPETVTKVTETKVPPTTGKIDWQKKKASEKTMKLLRGLAEKVKWTEDDILAACPAGWNTPTLEHFTQAQASEVILFLQDEETFQQEKAYAGQTGGIPDDGIPF